MLHCQQDFETFEIVKLNQADIGRRDEPYRRTEKDFDGRVRRFEPYRRKLSLLNPTQPNLT